MEKNTLNLPTQKDLKKIPTDETANATIVDLKLTTWFDLTKDSEKRLNLKNPTGKVLVVTFDALGFIRTDSLPIDEVVTTRSKYGRFLIKYNLKEDEDFLPHVGMEIKVLFNSDGNPKIILAK